VRPQEFEAATLAWLESLRERAAAPGSAVGYATDLALAAEAEALVDADRERDGVLRHAGELAIEQLAVADADPGTGLVRVELNALLTFPADTIEDGRHVAPGRAYREVTIALGPLWFRRDDESGAPALVDYTRDGLRMSSMWCTHPQGEDARDGLAAVPQAVTAEAHRGGRVFVEVSNALEQDVVLRIGRPGRPRGLFARQPPVTAPEIGLPVPAGGVTHFAGLTRRSRWTEIELFAFDAAGGQPLAALLVPIELPRGHPGQDGQWCG
jgi:hypothetical protein